MPDPFDFDHFLAIPRLSGLRLSPDGTRLVVAVATPAPDGKSMRTALWSIDPDGTAAPRRLTRSAAGESQAAFLPDGSLVFTSSRPDPDAKPEPTKETPPAGLWQLDADGGEARILLAPPAGIAGFAVAERTHAIALLVPMHPDASDLAADGAREKARTEAGVAARLYEAYPIQYWDHYLGPREPRILAVDAPADSDAGQIDEPADLTGPTGTALPEPSFDISPDGWRVVTTWRRGTLGAVGDDLVLIERSTHAHRTLTGGRGSYGDPIFSPDGRSIAATFATDGTKDEAVAVSLVVLDVESGAERRVAVGLDQWPTAPLWTHDGRAILFTADDHGSAAIFRVDLEADRVTRLAGDASYADVSVSPDDATIYALRSHPDRPPHVVRLDARTADQIPIEVRSPAPAVERLPQRGIVERLSATADDGVEIGSWLIRPASASPDAPAPLVVFVHGGPLGTWAGWSWRWNANLLVERGYAVLMPDPAISLGYGQAFIDRGWGTWGDRPYTDVLVAVDGALERADLDASRTALMGGSFGGYMANWVAGHTERFGAIVTHASLWDLRGFHGVTDDGVSWEQEMGDPYVDPSRYEEHSPSRAVEAIRTPMLVIHGELDARVPISEGLRLWTDLKRHGVDAKFLYYPDENHWILKPQNARVWYETVLAFLDHHVLGREWVRPSLL